MKNALFGALFAATSSLAMTDAAFSATYTYDFSGSFGLSWSLDNNNGRVPIPGGNASGYFVLDIDDVTSAWSVLDYRVSTNQPMVGAPDVNTVYDFDVPALAALPGAPLSAPAAALPQHSAYTGTINLFDYVGAIIDGQTWAVDWRQLIISLNPYEIGNATTRIQLGEAHGYCGYSTAAAGGYNVCPSVAMEGQQYEGWGTATLRTVDVSTIPLPAAGWLLLAGLGGLAAAGRRQRTA